MRRSKTCPEYDRGGFEFDGFFERFVSSGLFQILAHLVINIALEREQLRAARPKTMDPHTRSSIEGNFGTEAAKLLIAANPAIPTRRGK